MHEHIFSFKTILAGIAFSPTLKANVHEVTRLSIMFDAKLILVHVGEKTPDKEGLLASVFEGLPEQHPDTEIMWKEGNPVTVILEICRERKVDLLIAGALQREKLLTYYVGSIARQLSRKVNCSLLLLIKPSEKRVRCKHIVVNGLQNPKTAQTIQYAFYMARKLGAGKITIVEEISKNEIHVKVDDDRSLRRATIVKERIARREDIRVRDILEKISLEEKGTVVVKTQNIFGKRGYSIGYYARVVRADLLVMNSPDRKFNVMDRLFPHDIEYILSDLPTDLLIIRQ